MRPCHYRSRWLSLRGEMCAGNFIYRHSPWGHVRVGGGHMSSISGNANRASPRAKTGERADAVVHPLTLALCRLTKCSRCIYAHMCCRTMTRSVDDAAETETGTRREMKRKICLFSIGPELLTSILGYFL